jgi:hypothetical protein
MSGTPYLRARLETLIRVDFKKVSASILTQIPRILAMFILHHIRRLISQL